jgi:hypothetical protein
LVWGSGEGEVALGEGAGVEAEDVPDVEAAELEDVAAFDEAEVVGDDAVAGLGEVGLRADAQPGVEAANGDGGEAVVAVVESLREEVAGDKVVAGGQELDLLVGVGDGCRT